MQLAYVETFESKKEPRKSKGRPARVHQGTQGEGLCGSVGVRARVCVCVCVCGRGGGGMEVASGI